MNIVTASFNTTVRRMTEMSHDQNVSEKNRASEQWCV